MPNTNSAMKKLIPLIAFSILPSCNQDCSKCETQLAACMKTQTLSVDLPEEEPVLQESDAFFMTIEINENDQYLVDQKEYSLAELGSVVDQALETTQTSSRKIKVEGHKMAHYEAVLLLISF